MAYNVLSMRYPQSRSGSASHQWISGINPADTELTEAGAEIVRKQKPGVDAADAAVSSLKSLDREIAELLTKRECACFEVVNSSAAATKAFSMSYNDAAGMYKDFIKNGFAGEKAKKAVSWLRKILFDDSKAVYREIVCVDIRFMEYDAVLSFVFEHTPSARCFSVGVPVLPSPPKKAGGAKRPHSAWFEAEDYSSRRITYPGGDRLCTRVSGIDLVQPYNNGSSETVAYHYDLRVFKKQLDDYVGNGFKTPVKDEDDGYISFNLYRGVTEPPMSEMEYYHESR